MLARKDGRVKEKGTLFHLRDTLLTRGVINDDEAQQITQADALRLKVINVDSFNRNLRPHQSVTKVKNLKSG